MALRELDETNIRHDIDGSGIDGFYADLLREVIAEITENWGWGGVMINNGKGDPCGDCQIGIYYESPRQNNYKDWVWIQILGVEDCNLWIHLNYMLGNNLWGWSVWKDSRFPNGKLRPGFNMPPDFVTGPVYKSENLHGDLSLLFREICGFMPRLCNCMM